MSIKYICRKDAAKFLTERGIIVAPATLAKYATVGGGPEMTKFNRRVLYTEAALDAWLASKLRTYRHTSELRHPSEVSYDR